MTARVVALLLLVPSLALAGPASLSLERVDEAGEAIGPVEDAATLGRGDQVRFVTETDPGLYLYLLQTTARGTNVVWPGTGDVWVSRAGRRTLIPRPPNHRDETAPLTGWNGEEDGAAEYFLVSAPTPRAVPADSWVPSVDEFLLGPPWLTGPAAAKAAIIAKTRVSWGEARAPGAAAPADAPPDDPTAD